MLFDADGVVVNPQMQFARLLEREYGITRAMTRPFFNGPFNACLVGKADLAEALLPFLDGWGWREGPEAFIDLWLRADDNMDQELLALIGELRRGGLVCGLATSQERRRAAYMRAVMGFEAHFDRLFFSCEIGWQKPEAEFYAEVERQLGLRGEEILFWDDLEENVAAARAAGWGAEVYDRITANTIKYLSLLGSIQC